MIGLKVLLTGLVLFVALAVVKKVHDPIESDTTYIILGLGVFLAFITVFTGALIMVWSL